MTMHRFDPLSFVFGVVFVSVAVIGLLEPELLSLTDLRWVAPGALVVLGALLLALSGRSREDTPDDRPGDDGAPTDGSTSHATEPDVSGGSHVSGDSYAGSASGADARRASDGATSTPDTVEGDRSER